MKGGFVVLMMCILAREKTAAQYLNIDSADSLRKYSYNISGAYKDAVYTTNYSATGFFITAENRKVFVTAGHVLSGCKDIGGATKKFPDSLSVYLNDENGHFTNESIITNVAAYRDTGACPATRFPDIGILPLPRNVSSPVYAIDELTGSDSTPVTGALKIIGFPVNNNVNPSGYARKESSLLVTENYEMIDSVSFINDNTELDVDVTNYIVIPKDMTIDANLNGFSGSPVFENRENAWHFIGVLMGANIKRKYLVIVKARYLKEKLINH